MQTVRPRRKPAGRRFFPRRKVCQFCVDKVTIDYKDVQRIRRFVSEWGKIESRRKTGTCSPHQRHLSTAIKRARYLAWLPYTGGHSQIDLGRPDRGGPRGPRPPFRDGPPRDYAPSSTAPPASDAPSANAPAPETAGPETSAAEALAVEAPAAEAEAAPAEAEAAGGSEDAADDSDK
jgi:small subunit ribosomal protein S18